MSRANENLNVPRKVTRVWSSAVGADAPTLDASGICASRINANVVGEGGTLVVTLEDGTDFTYKASEFVSGGWCIEGQFAGIKASGSSGIYDLRVEW